MQTEKRGVILNLMDLPGKDSFVILNRMYLRDANAAIIVYDVNAPETLENAEVWLKEL
jgi:GTPase SAR1 family protein